jgi:hypothetical protein
VTRSGRGKASSPALGNRVCMSSPLHTPIGCERCAMEIRQCFVSGRQDTETRPTEIHENRNWFLCSDLRPRRLDTMTNRQKAVPPSRPSEGPYDDSSYFSDDTRHAMSPHALGPAGSLLPMGLNLAAVSHPFSHSEGAHGGTALGGLAKLWPRRLLRSWPSSRCLVDNDTSGAVQYLP